MITNYSSPTLPDYLHQYKIGACGTLQKNRLGLPIFEEIDEAGEQVFFYHTDNRLALQWHDKGDVIMLSTLHKPVMISTGKVASVRKQQNIMRIGVWLINMI